jgi:hypothetical protein
MSTKGHSALRFVLTAFEPSVKKPRPSLREPIAADPRVEAPPNGSPAAWDPYDVWLTRVKLPRDRRSRGDRNPT